MSYVATPGLLLPPKLPTFQQGTLGTATGSPLTASTDRMAFIFQCPKAGTLAKIHFLITALTTGEDLKCSFQDVDGTTANSPPDGTADQFRVVSAPGGTGWFTTGLMTDDGTNGGVKRTVTQGQVLAVVIEWNAFSAGNLTIGIAFLGDGSSQTGVPILPYTLRRTGGTWQVNSRGLGCFALEYDDGSFAELETVGCLPFKATTIQQGDTGTTPDEFGLRFQPPFNCKVDGVWFHGNTSDNYDVVLYDTDGATVLASVSMDKDVRDSTGNAFRYARFTSQATLTAGGTYRVVLKPTTATSNSVGLWYFDVESASLLGACALGTEAHWTQRTNAGAWTETTTRRPFMGLQISEVETPAAAGGGGSFGFVG